jgi:hypothetical protein
VASGQPNDSDSTTSAFWVASTSPRKLWRAAGPHAESSSVRK